MKRIGFISGHASIAISKNTTACCISKDLQAEVAPDSKIITETDTLEVPAPLITALRPEVFVKIGGYSLEDLHGEMVLLPLVKGRSTTAIIRKISAWQLSHPA